MVEDHADCRGPQHVEALADGVEVVGVGAAVDDEDDTVGDASEC
jgi:hypothetical protein